jgi:hypothetical protein
LELVFSPHYFSWPDWAVYGLLQRDLENEHDVA